MRCHPKPFVLATSALVLFSLAGIAEEIGPCDTALITINLDSMTVGFAGLGLPYPDDWRTVDDRHIVEANAELIPAAREAGVLVIYVYGDYPFSTEGHDPCTFAEEIAPEEGDILIGRPPTGTNVFLDTMLQEILEERGIRNVLFSGLNTAYCVDRSARMALRLGFDVTVVADAHSGGSPRRAESHNDWWATLGIDVMPIDDLDFAALCAPEAASEVSADDAN